MHKYLQICKKNAFIILNSIILVVLLYCSLLYAQHIDLFSQQKVVILGNKYVKQKIILDAMNMDTEESIFSYDLGKFQDNMESIEFIKSDNSCLAFLLFKFFIVSSFS